MEDWYIAKMHKSLPFYNHLGIEVPLHNMDAKNTLEQMVFAYFMSKDPKEALQMFRRKYQSYECFPTCFIPSLQQMVLEYISPTDYLDELMI